MDLKSLTMIVVGVLPVIIGVTEFVKKFNVKGEILTLIDFVVGAVIAGMAWAYITFPDAQMWITFVFVTLIGGMAAAGTYDLVDSRFPKQK